MQKHLPLLTALFVTLLIISNIVAAKIGTFFGVFLPVAVVVFPATYVLGDVITEVYGYTAMRRVIWTGFLCNLVAVAVFQMSIQIPSAPFFNGQEAFDTTLGATTRILGASFIAYLVGGFSNAFILAKLKVKTNGKMLWLRTIVSTLIGEGLDSVLFITLAFYGVFEAQQIQTLILTQWLTKVSLEVIVTPITYGVISYLKRTERLDTYDNATNFSPLPF